MQDEEEETVIGVEITEDGRRLTRKQGKGKRKMRYTSILI